MTPERGNEVTVCIASIPPRRDSWLPLAIKSALAQEYPISAVSVAFDLFKRGAGPTRQEAVDAARTKWVAILDDDDELYPQHVRRLVETALETGADYVYSYWDLSRTPDILHHFGEEFDPEHPICTTSMILVRTEVAQSIRYREPLDGPASGEDYRFTLDCVAAGVKIVHLPEQTWYWRIFGQNTSGLPSRWA